jgi:TolB-like protein/Tfp pilus assembly protein PilF
MSDPDRTPELEALSPEQTARVREHLKELLASNAFTGSKRSQDFLQLIVEHTLADELDALRERMIGAEMFGRPIDYDTANDAVVRVKATEVRKKLSQYYLEATKKPAVRIEIPTGTYVAKFHWKPLESPARPQPEATAASAERPAVYETLRPGQERTATLRDGIFRPSPRSLAAIFVALCFLVVIGYVGFKRPFGNFNPHAEIRSIAVLPLQNLSGDPRQDYFADGMTEELCADLGQISALRVISRTSAMSYRGTKKTLPEIGRELGVDTIVEGSVLREGNQVRITAQLIDARTDQHLWARTYVRDLTSVLALQSEVAKEIADEIRVNVTPQVQARLARSRSVNERTQDLYLQGEYLLTSGGEPTEIVENFQKAVDTDPNYAPAHAALAEAYARLGEGGLLPYAEAYSRQKSEATKAIELDETLSEGHAELAGALLNLGWDFTNPEKEFKRAIELNPNSASVRTVHAFYLERIGRISEGLAEMDLVLLLDPVSSRSAVSAGFAYYFAHQFDQAMARIKKAYTLEPNRLQFFFPLGDIYAEQGKYAESVAEFQKIGDQPHALGHMGNAYARMGRVTEAREMISRLQGHVEKSGIGRYEIALVYAGLRENDAAFSWLEKALQACDKGLTYLLIDPCVDPLRTDPRFASLVKRVGLPL